MTDLPIVTVSNLSKSYIIHDEAKDQVRSFFGGDKHTEYQALKNISFELYPGEVLGIIGPNGAGKSTLLRVIGGMLAPTTGQVEVHGKMHALFELSSGFNSHLSGRENLMQKAALLGLTHSEIMLRFDEIVSFAELEDFIDQPLHTYSTGMQARLAFATATSIDADIFLIDEILAVGDEYFQGQCRQRIREMIKKGKSAILVTHDLPTYLRMCNRGIYLEKGAVISTGNHLMVGERYISTFSDYVELKPFAIKIRSLQAEWRSGTLVVHVAYQAEEYIEGLDVTVGVEKIDSFIGWETCFLEKSSASNLKIGPIQPGETGIVSMHLIAPALTGKGRYYLAAAFRPAGKPTEYYDSKSWTTKDFENYFEIEDGTHAVFSMPVHYEHEVLETESTIINDEE